MRHCTNHYKTYPSLSAATAWLEKYITYGCDLQKYYFCVSDGEVHSLCCYYLGYVWFACCVDTCSGGGGSSMSCRCYDNMSCHCYGNMFVSYLCVC